MNVGSLFSGVGGFDLGLERAGMSIKWQVECDPFARRVLAARWPGVECFDDVCAVFAPTLRKPKNNNGWRGVDLLCGGFPCQDLSIAGRRAGLAGDRSGLFYEFVRIAKTCKPRWGLVENVTGLFSSHGGRDLAAVLEGLRECWPVVGYAVLDSQYFGVPQRRRRVFLVGGPTEHSVEQVLFESQGRSGDSPASDEAGTHLAASLRSRSARPGVNPPGRGGEDDMNIVVADPVTCNPYSDKISEETQMGGGRNGCGIGQEGDPMFTLQASKQHAVGVRRLTPTECERLQGFPDGWTCLCQPLEQYDSMRCTCPDGPRYKTMGNAVTVQVIKFLGSRIMEVHYAD